MSANSEVEAAPEADEGELSTITTLAERLQNENACVTQLEEQLKAAKEAARITQEVDLPQAMLDVGMRAFTMKNGFGIDVVTTHHAGISQANQPAAFAYLKETAHDDIIKRDVTITFGRGEETLAAEALTLLRSKFSENKVVEKASIHAQTLGAYVREQLREGAALPTDVFGIYTRTYAQLTPPGGKRPKHDEF